MYVSVSLHAENWCFSSSQVHHLWLLLFFCILILGSTYLLQKCIESNLCIPQGQVKPDIFQKKIKKINSNTQKADFTLIYLCIFFISQTPNLRVKIFPIEIKRMVVGFYFDFVVCTYFSYGMIIFFSKCLEWMVESEMISLDRRWILVWNK